MSLKISTVEQGTPEWFDIRKGMPTASMFSTVMSKGRGKEPSKTRAKYLRQLAGEILTGEPMESYSNPYMERGKLMEQEAIDTYAFEHAVEPELVGFMYHEDLRVGCSPDRLVGEDGLVECKTKTPHLQIELLEIGKVPSEHMKQIQGQLWVSGREWCDFISYWPRLPLFTDRVYRDESMIKDIQSAVEQFNSELDDIVEYIRNYRSK